MGRYIDWSFLVSRSPSANTIGGAADASSAWIVPTEFEVDGLLSTHFTTPFSSNNMTVKEIVCDFVYAKIAVGKDKHASKYKERAMEVIDRLKAGTMNMITTDGTVITASKVAAWSNTMDYHPVFGVANEMYQTKDVDQLEAEDGPRQDDVVIPIP